MTEELPDIKSPSNSGRKKKLPPLTTNDEIGLGPHQKRKKLNQKKKIETSTTATNRCKRVSKKTKQPTCTVVRDPEMEVSDEEKKVVEETIVSGSTRDKQSEGEGRSVRDTVTKKEKVSKIRPNGESNELKGYKISKRPTATTKADKKQSCEGGKENKLLPPNQYKQDMANTKEPYIQFSDENEPTEFLVLGKRETDSDSDSLVIPFGGKKLRENEEDTPLPPSSHTDTDYNERDDINLSSSLSPPISPISSATKVVSIAQTQGSGKGQSHTPPSSTVTTGPSQIATMISQTTSSLKPHLKLSSDGRPTTDHVITGQLAMQHSAVRHYDKDMLEAVRDVGNTLKDIKETWVALSRDLRGMNSGRSYVDVETETEGTTACTLGTQTPSEIYLTVENLQLALSNFAKGMEDREWTALLQVAFSNHLAEMREVEVAYKRILDKLGDKAKDRIFEFFVENGPAVTRCVTLESNKKILFLVIKQMMEKGLLPVYGPDCTTAITLSANSLRLAADEHITHSEVGNEMHRNSIYESGMSVAVTKENEDINPTSALDSGVGETTNTSNIAVSVDQSCQESDIEMEPPLKRSRRKKKQATL